MRCFFVLLLLLLPGIATASENLIENLQTLSNTSITDGVVTQIKPDDEQNIAWKLQIMPGYNLKFYFYNGNTGFISHTFTTSDDLDGVYFRFGINGSTIDSVVSFGIKDLMPNTTYTLQWRVLNTTQGQIAWTDMRIVHCGDGYSLALGDENCSRVCENESVAGGHIPADITKVYEPATCSYNQSKLVCNNGWTKIDNTCEQMCTAGITHLHAGGNKNGLYARRLGSPALHVKYNGNICYGHLAPGGGAGLNIRLDGVVYHLID